MPLSVISKAQIKSIRALQQKKHRYEQGCFVVEGEKLVLELLSLQGGQGVQCLKLVMTEDFAQAHEDLWSRYESVWLATAEQLAQMGQLQSNRGALAVVAMPKPDPLICQPDNWTLVLDCINDPGNLGTILRVADWFGIEQVVCSANTVDVFNPKVVAAAKGSLLRVMPHVRDLPELLSQWQGLLPILGAVLDGESAHDLPVLQGGVLVMGNESHGISPAVAALIDRPVTIPSYGGGAESLNVAMATGILCDNLRRLSCSAK